MGFFGPSGGGSGGGLAWSTDTGAAGSFSQTGTTPFQNTTGAGLLAIPTGGTGTVHLQISHDGTNWLDLGTGNSVGLILFPPNWYVKQVSGSVSMTWGYFKAIQ